MTRFDEDPELARRAGKKSTSRPFRDKPGLASEAGRKSPANIGRNPEQAKKVKKGLFDYWKRKVEDSE